LCNACRAVNLRLGQAWAVVDPEELARLGLYDPDGPDADERLELLTHLLSLGATVDEIRNAPNPGELALDLVIRPRTGTTFGAAADAAGVDWSTASRLFAAAGIIVRRGEPVTPDDEAGLRLLVASRELLGDAATIQLGRVSGSAIARIAEALVAAFRLEVELPRRNAGTAYTDFVKEYAAIAETLLPEFVRMLDALLRRQIVAVAERTWSTDEQETAVMLPRAIGFADLVGYTAAVARISSRQLADVLVAFDERIASVVLAGRGQVIKTIGDEAMFVTERAEDACRIALELVRGFGDGQLPPVRVGLAVGDVVTVFGDVYGPDVNLAARLVAIAEPSTVVVSDRVRAECEGVREFDALEPRLLKGFAEPVTPYRLRR
jgi:adenylate cyclase